MNTKELRQKILDLAIHGKLVPQDPNDEPASVLLERIKAEKERLIKEGKIKRAKKSAKFSDTPHYQQNVPFEVPEGWVWCKLGDIANFQGGYAYKSNTYVNQSDWQVIRIGNVKNDNLLLDTQPVFVEDIIGKETAEKYLLQKDDILFTMTGTKGKRDYFYSVKVPLISKKLLLNQRVGCLRSLSPEVDIDFICFALKGKYVLDAIFSTETGNVSQGNISSENTLNLNIAIPPLAEQHRIVDEIKRWFALIYQIEKSQTDLQTAIKQAKSKILDIAIHGKLVSQDPNDEPASELLKRINPKAEITSDNGHYPQLPAGWAICRLEDIVKYEQSQAYIVSSTNYDDSYTTPVLTAGKSFIIGYTDDMDGIYTKLPCIIFDDFTTDSRLVDFPFKVKSSAMKILQVVKGIEIEYVAMFMSITRLISDTHKRYWISEYSKLYIAIPPIEEQRRIINTTKSMFEKLDAIMESL